MCVLDEVAGLPEGQRLAALARQVEGSPAALRDLADSWTWAAASTADGSAAVDGAVSRVAQTWQGRSSTAFSDLMSRFRRASGTTHESLSSAAATLNEAADALQQVQACVDRICENLLCRVAQLRAAHPGMGAEVLDPRISPLVAEAVDEVGAAIATFEHTLSRASTTLSGVTPKLKAFSTLPRVGGTGSGAPTPSSRIAHDRGPMPEPPTDTGVAAAVPPASGESGAPPQVDAWIGQATRILASSGTPASQLNPRDLWLIIQHESGGNPSAVNNWDGNAAAGTPSTGLMQTIAPTFHAYALPGHENITDPVDNIIAGTRYALARYGSLDNVPGVIAVHNGQSYVGY